MAARSESNRRAGMRMNERIGGCSGGRFHGRFYRRLRERSCGRGSAPRAESAA